MKLPIADVTPLPPIATNAPNRPAPAVKSCALAASHRLKPDFSRIAKSPTSCGISCTVRKTVMVKQRVYMGGMDARTD